MAKRQLSGKCVHCLKFVDKLTWDHVFPAAWYPETTPDNLEKWKIPACEDCNRAYGKLEADLLWRFGLSVDPKDFRSAGITQKVIRSTLPQFAKDERDRLQRLAKRAKILREAVRHAVPPSAGVLPNFGIQPGVEYDGYHVIPLPNDSLVRLGQKIVRGMTYILRNSLIDDSYRVNVYFVTDEYGASIVKALDQRGASYSKGPGIVVKEAVTDEGGLTSLWYIEIWGRLKMYATVVRTQASTHRDNSGS